MAIFAREFGYVWRDLTGRMPGKKKDQRETPFGEFVVTLAGWDRNQPLPIVSETREISPARRFQIESGGYLSCWEKGEVPPQK